MFIARLGTHVALKTQANQFIQATTAALHGAPAKEDTDTHAQEGDEQHHETDEKQLHNQESVTLRNRSRSGVARS